MSDETKETAKKMSQLGPASQCAFEEFHTEYHFRTMPGRSPQAAGEPSRRGIPGCQLHEAPREQRAQDGDTMLVGLSMLIVVFLAGAGAGIMLASLW